MCISLQIGKLKRVYVFARQLFLLMNVRTRISSFTIPWLEEFAKLNFLVWQLCFLVIVLSLLLLLIKFLFSFLLPDHNFDLLFLSATIFLSSVSLTVGFKFFSVSFQPAFCIAFRLACSIFPDFCSISAVWPFSIKFLQEKLVNLSKINKV